METGNQNSRHEILMRMLVDRVGNEKIGDHVWRTGKRQSQQGNRSGQNPNLVSQGPLAMHPIPQRSAMLCSMQATHFTQTWKSQGCLQENTGNYIFVYEGIW